MNEPNDHVAKPIEKLPPIDTVADSGTKSGTGAESRTKTEPSAKTESNTESQSAKVTDPQFEKTIDKNETNRSFEQLAVSENIGILREFMDFLANNKKWWLTPIIIVLLIVGVMIALTTSGAAPFLYTFW